MIGLKDRHKCPPNGFQYTQAQTGWSNTWWDFETAAREIRDHRLGNPRFNLSTNIDDIRAELDQVNALRCMSIRGGEIYVNQEASPVPKSFAPSRLAPVVGGAVNAIASGLETTEAFFDSGGKTVSKELSEKRARICAVCPVNGRGDWTRFFTVPAANLIRKRIEKRNQMKLSTSFDDQLGICQACLCPLKLKVHYPLNVIVDHMTDEVKSALHESCWITKEQ